MRFALACAFGLMAGQAGAACVDGDGAWIDRVCYSDAQQAPLYGHGILGNTPEWSSLDVFYGPDGLAASDGQRTANAILPLNGIYEDVVPRLLDIDGDDRPEAIVVHSDYNLGARISVVGFDPEPKLIASTPHIGQRNRWYAPIGAADLDGDGTIEIAYIDRPHLAKTLRIVSIQGDLLAEEIAGAGFTNHRIGERDIAGGVRDCGAGPEMIVASADWSQLVAVTYDGTALTARQIGTDTTRPAFAAAMACQ